MGRRRRGEHFAGLEERCSHHGHRRQYIHKYTPYIHKIYSRIKTKYIQIKPNYIHKYSSNQFEFQLSMFVMLLCESSEGLLAMANGDLSPFYTGLCLFICLLKEFGSEQEKSHWLHLLDFSALCVFKCVLKLPEMCPQIACMGRRIVTLVAYDDLRGI